MSDNQQDQTETSVGKILFWLLWVLALVLFPFYGFTFFFEVGAVKSNNIGSQISPIIGAVVFIAQIAVMVISFKQMNTELPISKPYLTLLGGTIIILFIWFGGCVIMGPMHFH